MHTLFNPSSIAVIGVSRNRRKVGNILFRNLLNSFRGRLYGININGGEVEGKRLYKDIRELPEIPDLVILTIPSEGVPKEVEKAYDMGVRSFIVISGGFGESGRKDLDEELRKFPITLLGPNCLGIYSPRMNATFLSPERMDFPPEGDIAIVSQSGALMSAVLDMLAQKGEGVSYGVSLGNKLLLDEVDVLHFLGEDSRTGIILLYLEDTRRGRELYETLKRITPKKPVIVLKGGKTKAGIKAASTHTEALSSSELIFSGMLKQAGAIEVDSFEEMMNVLLALKQPLPRGRKLLIITNGGGYGVIAADIASKEGFELPPYKGDTDLPPRVSLSNPVDLTGDAPPEWYEEILMKGEGYHAALVIITPQLEGADPSLISILKHSPIPVYTFVPGGRYAHYLRETLIRNGVPSFTSIEDAVRSIKKVVNYSLKRLVNA